MTGMEVLMIAGTAMSALSSIQGGNAQAAAISQSGRNAQAIANYNADVAEQQGISQQRIAQYKADQSRTAAGQERASAQRAALEEKRKGRLAQSTAIARGAAGGATAEDIYSTLAGIGAEAEYGADVQRYQGEESARGFLDQGAIFEYEGSEALRASKMAAGGYRTQGAMDYSTSKMEAATARTKGYTDAMGSLTSFAGSSSGQSLMGKYGGGGVKSGMTDSQWSSFLKRN